VCMHKVCYHEAKYVTDLETRVVCRQLAEMKKMKARGGDFELVGIFRKVSHFDGNLQLPLHTVQCVKNRKPPADGRGPIIKH
jgi:hypothetical protein